ncbi:MAG TPA: HD domain-containing protein [Methanospirillum sp.]|nr:HD domain-containing protein [Methanospirillum sp.]
MREEMLVAMKAYVTHTLPESGAHGLDHTLRVYHLCEGIARIEGAECAIMLPAALFHDIARPLEDERGVPHEEEGARIAEKFLKRMQYSPDLIPPIVHAIRAHRYRSAIKPETLEAQILSDADKLDAMGAIGIARAFMTAGERQGDMTDAIDHMHEKLVNLKDMMYTETARRIAKERHSFLVGYIEVLYEEMGGHTHLFSSQT